MYNIKDLTSFISKSARPLIVIFGPTASGKTGLSLEIAEKINGEVISTDSRQIYKGMEIGTAAISPKEQKDIPHHMIGITTPDKTVTLSEFKDMALKKIDEIYKRGHVPMLVGGTGLYIDSIIEGYDVPRVPADEKLRAQLQKEADEKGAEYLHDKLKKLDLASAGKIHPNNIRYVVRAIEIATHSGKPKMDKKEGAKFDVYIIEINLPRKELYERINQRVEEQVKKGLVDEVRALLDKEYDEDLPSMSSLGVKEIIPFLKGEKSLEECKEILKKNTRNYAKRQMTWQRRRQNLQNESSRSTT